MLNTQLSYDQRELTICISDKFDYSLYKEFRDAYKEIKKPNTNFCIDLSGTRYIDSSALGMLLLVKEHAEKLGGRVYLKHPSKNSMKILEIANFDQLFQIHTH